MAISSRMRIERNRHVHAALIGLFLFCVMVSGQGVLANPSFSNASTPRMAEAGQPIPIAISITDQVNITYVQVYYEREGDAFPSISDLNLTDGTRMNGTWSGEIPPQKWECTLTCSIIVDDGLAKYPAQGSFFIDVDGPSPSTFPWNWVIIGAFLAVAFIATELAFKPRIWRPTGRERARALEEEDRRKALEEQRKDEETFPDGQEDNLPDEQEGAISQIEKAEPLT